MGPLLQVLLIAFVPVAGEAPPLHKEMKNRLHGGLNIGIRRGSMV